jgi:hypothetical protein
MFAGNDHLAKIAKLIEQAEEFRRHGEDGSADAALARADAMMVKYAIDRAVVESHKPRNQREMPTSIDFTFVPIVNPWYFQLAEMLGAIADAARCKFAFRSEKAFLVGFESDIEYARMLWNGVYFAFVSKLDPSWDTARPVDENIKILKEAGWSWPRIATVANAHGFECSANDGRLKAAYRRQCKLEGVEPTPHTQRHEAYRQAYARSFAGTIRTRLWRQQRAAKDQVAETGTAVILADRFGDVEARFFEMFPNLRPMSTEELKKLRAEQDARDAAEQALYEAMTPTQKAAYDRKQAKQRQRDAADWEREHAKRQDAAGAAAGRSAAAQVDLGGTKLGPRDNKELEG